MYSENKTNTDWTDRVYCECNNQLLSFWWHCAFRSVSASFRFHQVKIPLELKSQRNTFVNHWLTMLCNHRLAISFWNYCSEIFWGFHASEKFPNELINADLAHTKVLSPPLSTLKTVTFQKFPYQHRLIIVKCQRCKACSASVFCCSETLVLLDHAYFMDRTVYTAQAES